MSNEAHEKGLEGVKLAYIAYGYQFEKLIRSYLQASNQVLVTREPTEEMSEKGEAAFSKDEFHMSVYHCVGEAYKAMVEAAPKPFEGE